MSQNLLPLLTLMARLKDELVAIPHPDFEGELLFEVVEYHEDKNLAEALQDLLILKQRVCLIVPAGDKFSSEKEARVIKTLRTSSVDLVFADRAYTKGGQDAAFGGEKNIGVARMQQLVVERLAANPTLAAGEPAADLPWCLLVPTEGAFVEIAADDAKKIPGRQAWAMNYETPSGEILTPINDGRILRAPFP